MSKPVEKLWTGLFCSCFPVRDLVGVGPGKRVGIGQRRVMGVRVKGF